jgi:hypothetical protein
MRHSDARMFLTEQDRDEAIKKIRNGRVIRRVRRLMKSPTRRLIERIQELEREREDV